nr:putative ribonuclease H-like domain-containing protein [Tanacetum cinerariifolium]
EGDSVEMAITTDASLVAAYDSDNIAKTQSTTLSIDPISQEIGSGDKPRRQETTLRGADAQTRFKTASKRSSDPPLSTGHTVGSREDEMEQETDLTDFVPPIPYGLPLSRGHTPRSDEDLVIQRLLKKVKRLEKKQRARTPGMKLFKIGTSKKKTLDKEYVSKQGRDESKEAKELNLSDKGSDETEVFDYTTAAEKDVNVAEPVFTAGDAVNAASVVPDVSVVGPSTSTAGDIFEDEMITMTDTLMAIRRTIPRTTLIVIHDVEEEPRRSISPPTVQSQDKGKGKMVKPEPILKNPIKAHIQRDPVIAQRLFEEEQAQLEREQRIVREKAAEQEANDAALIEQMEDVQARIDANALLSERLQQEEREQITVDEQVRMLVDLIAERKSEQQAEGSKKRSRVNHDKESVKKQKLEDDDAEKEELRACLDIVLVDDIAINVESLATKYPIVDWKTHTLIENMIEEDVIWKAQQDYNLISYRLFDFCGIYVLLMDTGIAIHMLVERIYPLVQEMILTITLNRLERSIHIKGSTSGTRASKETMNGLHKGYDMFQSLLSQLETHGAGVSTEDANQKFLRSLPSFWSQVSLIMRTKPGVDTLNFDDLYNNLRVFESDVKCSTGSSSSTQNEDSSSYTDDLIYSFFANQSSGPQLDHEDLEHEESCILMPKNLLALTRAKLSASIATIQDTLLESADQKGIKTVEREMQETLDTRQGTMERDLQNRMNIKLWSLDGEGVDWIGHAEDETQDYALMAFNSSNSGSDTEKLLAEASQMSAKDKSGLGYGSQIHDGVLSYENEVFASVFDSRSGDVEDSPVNDRFAKVEGMYAVLPPMTGNYMPPKFDFRIDELKFTYGSKQSTTSESDAKTSDLDSCDSLTSVETLESVPKPVANEPKAVSEPKFCFSHLIRDCDFHEKRMAKQVKLNKQKGRSTDYQDFNSDPVAFGGSKGQITGKGKIRTGKLDFEDVYFVKELQHFNIFSVSQMCDKKNKVLFTDTKCLVLSLDFKLPDENQVLLRVPRQHNMYSFNLENIVPSGGLTCLIAKATVDESIKWHKRLGHVNLKNLNKLVKGNLVRDSTACYVLNRVLVTKHQNKIPYELLTGKFEEKYDEGFLVGYSLSSKAFRVYNLETKKVEENPHINFLENKPNVAGKGPTWLFDLDYLTDSMNYQPITAENKANKTAGPKEANNSAGTQDNLDAGNSEMKADYAQEYYVLPLWSFYTSTVRSSKAKNGDKKLNEDTAPKTNEELVEMEDQAFLDELERLQRQEKEANDAAETLRKTTPINAASTPLNTASTPTNQDDSQIPALEDIYDHSRDEIFTSASYDDEGAVADFTHLESTVNVSPIPTSKIHSIHPTTQILGDPSSTVQTSSKVNKSTGAHAFVRNKKDERGVVVRNKARLVAQGHRQEEWIDYDEVFAHVARIEGIRIFLAFASYIGFIVYQMDVKSAFLYGKIDEEVYVSQPPGFIDTKFPNKVYKVVKALYGLHQALRAWYATLSTFLVQSEYRRRLIDKTLFIKKDQKDIMLVQVYVDDIIFGFTKKSWCDEFEALMKNRFQMSFMGKLTFFFGLQVKQKEDGIFISQDKYVTEILKKFDFLSVKTASTPIETKKSLVKDEKDEEVADVDVHLYRSMIGSLMYFTASRPDVIYLKGQPKLGLWYPGESAFDLEAYSDNDYAGANLDRKSTTGGCQFLDRRLISWQCKKQTIVATSTTEAEYVAAVSCCGQILWIRNQILVMLLTLGKKMQFGLVLGALNEKTEGNSEFHEIVDFLTSSSIHHALTSSHDSPLSCGHTYDRAEGALNLEELFSICTNLSNRVLALETVKDAQVAEIIALKARIKNLEKKWRKKDKPEPILDDSTLDDLDADHGMDTEEPMNQERLSEETKELVSTARPEDSTVRPDVGTVDPIVPPPTTTNIEDSSRPARSILTLKPLPTIDPKDKGKGVLEEREPAKKMTRNAEVARLVYEEELAELEREREKRQREEASKAAIH